MGAGKTLAVANGVSGQWRVKETQKLRLYLEGAVLIKLSFFFFFLNDGQITNKSAVLRM